MSAIITSPVVSGNTATYVSPRGLILNHNNSALHMQNGACLSSPDRRLASHDEETEQLEELNLALGFEQLACFLLEISLVAFFLGRNP